MSAAPRTSLNAPLDWPETARLLDLPFHELALPARGPCPLCPNGRMTIYEDLRDGGAWFSCLDCKRAGDLIELAAALWGMELPATLSRLLRRAAPLPPEVETTQGVEGYLREIICPLAAARKTKVEATAADNGSYALACSFHRKRTDKGGYHSLQLLDRPGTHPR